MMPKKQTTQVAAAVGSALAVVPLVSVAFDSCESPGLTLCEPSTPLPEHGHEGTLSLTAESSATATAAASGVPAGPLPAFVNNSMMAQVQAVEEQSARDALFTHAVAQKNVRNAALFHLLNRAPAAEPPAAESSEGS